MYKKIMILCSLLAGFSLRAAEAIEAKEPEFNDETLQREVRQLRISAMREEARRKLLQLNPKLKVWQDTGCLYEEDGDEITV